MSTRLSQPRLVLEPTCFRIAPDDPFGPVGLTFRVKLWIEPEEDALPSQLEFLVDSGASYSSIDLDVAAKNGLAVPPPEANRRLTLRTSTGLATVTARLGTIRCWWHEGLVGHPFDFPILFRVRPPSPQPLLGLGGVIRLCRWKFNPPSLPRHPEGSLKLEDAR